MGGLGDKTRGLLRAKKMWGPFGELCYEIDIAIQLSGADHVQVIPLHCVSPTVNFYVSFLAL